MEFLLPLCGITPSYSLKVTSLKKHFLLARECFKLLAEIKCFYWHEFDLPSFCPTEQK